MNVHNMTILAKVCHVKLNRKVSIYMEGMWSTNKFLRVCLGVTLYDNVHMYHSNSQLTG